MANVPYGPKHTSFFHFPLAKRGGGRGGEEGGGGGRRGEEGDNRGQSLVFMQLMYMQVIGHVWHVRLWVFLCTAGS